jgi:dipeptidyl aminopeptidase/acylaminoacyl peptidase
MEADLRGTMAHGRVQRLYGALWQPGTGVLHGARDLQVVGDDLYFVGTCAGPTLDAGPVSSVWRLDAQGGLHACWPGARMCRVSDCGEWAAGVYALEGGEGGEALRLMPLQGDGASACWAVPGVIESLRWSPDGRQLLVLLAGSGADVAGIAGGYALRRGAGGPAWLPEVSVPGAADTWRSLWVWTLGAAEPRRLTAPPCNPWEASWCGHCAVLAVTSDLPGEGSWYQARLQKLNLEGDAQLLRVPPDQLGLPTASDDGRHIAWVEAVCSDRGLVCGTVMWAGDGGPAQALDTCGLQATDVQWRDARRLLVTGLRGLETAVAEIDVISGETRTLWTSGTSPRTLSGWQAQAVPCGAQAALVVMEGYDMPPAIVELSPGRLRTRLALGPERMPGVGRMERLVWPAADGLDIQGWLIVPEGVSPQAGWPLLVDVHGGPIGAHRPRWAANLRAAAVLAQQGWAVLLPNPRGSSGRGQDFARQVVGDMGGADLHDLLAGLDQLVAQGRVDPARVAVTGTSYGGYISCCMVTQTRRFAAAVPISPVSHWSSQHFGSQIPWFDTAFLNAAPQDPAGAYFQRSPVFQAQGATTPTLVMAGGRDKNTPTGQAVEFYNALVEAGAPCALAVYPQDGHSLRGMPAYLDSAARLVGWLDLHVHGPDEVGPA